MYTPRLTGFHDTIISQHGETIPCTHMHHDGAGRFAVAPYVNVMHVLAHLLSLMQFIQLQHAVHARHQVLGNS